MSNILDELAAAVGPQSLLVGDQLRDKAFTRWSRIGNPLAVTRPRSTDEVAAILRAANKARHPVVPWGGLTGLVDGAYAQDAIALSLERMARIEAIDPINSTITVEAGCPLQIVCEAVENASLFLPLDLGSRGSATIGGNIATNAGGNRVLRWGMMRDMVLGLEAVLADGTILTSMNSLIKNNTGYDLKHLFIGSEGTLGIITRAVLRLFPLPTSQNTAFVSVERFEQIPQLLQRLSRNLGESLSAFEVMWADVYELLTTAPARGKPVLAYGHPFYILIETMGADQSGDQLRFQQTLTEALEAEEVSDAIIAKSDSERKAMWAIRDDVSQTARNGPIFAFDVSLKISDMDCYVRGVRQALNSRWPATSTLMVFGHLGDGNLHLIVGVGDKSRETKNEIENIIYAPLHAMNGSISAEHGIGLQKKRFLSLSRNPEEVRIMRTLKESLDPLHILNPGKIFDI